MNTPAMRVKLDPRVLFPDDGPFSVALARLMLATDDVRHLWKLSVVARERVDEANDVEREILNGELQHFFRLMCGHLYEAMGAFRDLDTKHPALLDAAVAAATDAREALERALLSVRQACRDTHPPNKGAGKARGKRKSFVDTVRNFVGFHYHEGKLRDALVKHRAGLEGTAIFARASAFSRYAVTDQLVMLLIADEIAPRATLAQIKAKLFEAIGETLDLGGDLALVVDGLIAYHVVPAHRATIERSAASITIDPLIVRAIPKPEEQARPLAP